MHKKLIALTSAMMVSAQMVTAGPMEVVDLPAMTHIPATLVVVGADGTEIAYTAADLEAMTTYSMTTTTPWRDEPATFEGVLLADLLAANGLEDATIIVTAENDYSTSISSELIDTVDIMIATRVNGQPHNRRERGPIQFVIAHDAFHGSDLTSESNFVWMAAHIQAEN